MQASDAILALDVGGQRIGVARANAVARIASPLTTLLHDATIDTMVTKLLTDNNAAILVVGLPRGLDGQHTDQTRTVEQFVAHLRTFVTIPIYWQDEALTSRKAEEELDARGKPYAKGDIDALAATYILEDFLQGNDPDNLGVPA